MICFYTVIVGFHIWLKLWATTGPQKSDAWWLSPTLKLWHSGLVIYRKENHAEGICCHFNFYIKLCKLKFLWLFLYYTCFWFIFLLGGSTIKPSFHNCSYIMSKDAAVQYVNKVWLKMHKYFTVTLVYM